MKNDIKSKTSDRRSYLRRQFVKLAVRSIVLISFSFAFALPFVWMLLVSLKPLDQVGSENWIPQPKPWLSKNDFIDPQATLDYVARGDSQIAVFLRANISDTLRELIAKGGKPAKLLPALSNDFNALLTNRDFFTTTAFRNITVTQRIAGLNRVDDRALRNRYILMAALPGQLMEPNRFQWQNYLNVFKQIPYARYYWNTLFVAGWVTTLQVLTSALAAFAFARLRWKGRDKVFFLYLITMMLPGVVLSIPNYQIMIKLGLVDTLTGLIIPASFSTFGCFLLRQFMLSIPESIDEAAEIDGASKWCVFWDIILPLTRPGLVTLALFTFMGNYHSFFWPLVMLRSEHLYTLPIGLLSFDSSAGQETNLLMAAVTMSVFPVILIFIVLQKQLVHGIQLGGVKG